MIQNLDNFLFCRAVGKQYQILVSWIAIYMHVNLLPSLNSKMSKRISFQCVLKIYVNKCFLLMNIWVSNSYFPRSRMNSR